MRRVKFQFIWFDLWVGIFVDTKKKLIYVLPLPMCVFIFDYGQEVVE